MIDTYTAFGLVLFTLAILAFVAVAVRIGIAALERSHVLPNHQIKTITDFENDDVFCAPEGGLVRKDAHGAWVSFSDKEAA